MIVTNTIRLGLSLIFLAILAACSENTAAPTIPDVEADETASPAEGSAVPIIVMLGDSLTAGFGLPDGEALPAELERQLDSLGVSADLINAGVSGDTSANGLARYDWSVRAANPDILIIALGANDFLQGVSPSTVRDNLAAILTRAQDGEMDIVMAGLDPRETVPGQSITSAYTSVYEDLAAEFEVPLYPDLLEGVWDDPTLLQADGLHPTAEGIDLVAQQLAAFLIASNILEADES